jgi:hypothetical protein
MVGEFRTDLEPVVIRAEAEILKIVHAVVPDATLRRIGPMDITGPEWSCWIVTSTDRERERVAGDSALLERLHKAAADAGFAPRGFAVQSQETVDREYEGSWFYAMR